MTMKGCSAGHGLHALDERTPIDPKQVKRSETLRGFRASQEKIGRLVDSRGYARIKMQCHPRRCVDTGYVYEHIVAAELCLGRSLDYGEIVHHIDGDRGNSLYSNLIVFPSQGSHARFHGALRHGMASTPTTAALFGGIRCRKPFLSRGGPHWMQALRGRIMGITV